MKIANPATEERALRHNPEYRRWFGGEIMLSIGTGVGLFAFPLIALAVTGSPADAGTVGFIAGLGLVAGLLPGGVMTDRFERKKLVMIGGILGLITAGALIALLLAGAADLVSLSVIGFIDRLCAGLFGSASSAMLRQIATAKQLPTAVAVNQGRDAAVELGSGPLGGALLGINLALPIVVQALGHIGSVVMTLLMRQPYRGREADAAPTRPLADVRDGGRWMLRQPVRMHLGMAAALVNLGIGGVILTVTLSLADRGVDPALIGLLSTVLAAGMLLGSVAAPKIVAKVPTGMLTVVELCLIAASAAALPFLPNLWWIGAAYALMAFGIAPLNAGVMGYFTLITPKELMGRVSAFMGLLTMGLTPLAPAIAGWGLSALGDVGTMLIFAGVCVAAAGVAFAVAGIRTIPRSEEWESHARARGLL